MKNNKKMIFVISFILTIAIATVEANYIIGSQTFTFTGSAQFWTPPATTFHYLYFNAVGASGNWQHLPQQSYVPGGLGAVVSGNLSLSNHSIQIYIGGRDGYNGGGITVDCMAQNGAGATDIRFTNDLNSRIAVAGGGGGASWACAASGRGGDSGFNGKTGLPTYNECHGGPGGNQVSGGQGAANSIANGYGYGGISGEFGQGGGLPSNIDPSTIAIDSAGLVCFNGGGGGGYYGGAQGRNGGGGGGSSYCDGVNAFNCKYETTTEYNHGQLTIYFAYDALTAYPSAGPISPPATFNQSLILVPLQASTSCMKTTNISGSLVAEVTNLKVSSDLNVIVEGRFQASDVASVLNSHLLKVRWFVGGSSYRQTTFLNSTEISYPSNPNDIIQFRAIFPNFFPPSANFSGYLKTKVILTNWPLRKKAICLKWKRKY